MRPTHLIVVCCHGIWLGGPSAGHDESEWLIADFQKGETATFVKHIEAGLKALADDDKAILAFSGGPTRKETSVSEAQSYANLAHENAYFGIFPPAAARSRILVEPRALDSYHNILYSLTLFHAMFPVAWPDRVTIVSHEFKRERLLGCHCAAIRFPRHRVAFIGIDPPGFAGEAGSEQAVREWREDPHGRGPGLAGKRVRRNPWGVWGLMFAEGHGAKSGLRVLRTEDGGEVLDDEAERPWMRGDYRSGL